MAFPSLLSLHRRGISVLLLPSFLLCPSPSGAYNSSTCAAGCSPFDLVLKNCIYFNAPANSSDTSWYPDFVQCTCSAGGDLAVRLGYLSSCVVCDQGGLGANNLTTYQDWDVICGEWQAEGFQSAVSVLSTWDDVMFTSFFSASILPELQKGAHGTTGVAVGTVTASASSENLGTGSNSAVASLTSATTTGLNSASTTQTSLTQTQSAESAATSAAPGATTTTSKGDGAAPEPNRSLVSFMAMLAAMVSWLLV
ncbi:hypothetical protein PV11_05600 [Exophiala sideris]|uniref:Uncharacterized protein n=1 Tax=Exophiala sideris TaxID=1016849 RepID=A0A0D1X704_9EURO|nr:hypothetical protein PV11_05600 [Exophiala sideris]